MSYFDFPVIIVGSGLTGCTVANRIALEFDLPVVVLEKRKHIGGNSRAFVDPLTGIEVHEFGSHVFHTSDDRVWRYMNQFTSFNSYRHKAVIKSGGRVYSMPVNLKTVNDFYGAQFSPDEARAAIRRDVSSAGIAVPRNLEEKAVSLIGRGLYDRLIAGYTAKQWGRDPKKLPESIINRLPVRYTYNDDYFDDTWQGIPSDGYSRMFERMLKHPNIEVRTGVDYFSVNRKISDSSIVVYTGPIDEFFGFGCGKLEWRSLRFEFETLPVSDFQGTSIVNYGDVEVPWTRIHEFKHYHREWKDSFERPDTIICREFPQDWNEGREAFYPVNDDRNERLYETYREMARSMRNIVLCGRLGSYKYLDMDEAVAFAFDAVEEVKCRLRER